jgi:hypothetical protein
MDVTTERRPVTRLPREIAMFEVYVPVTKADGTSARAEEIVTRYLYSPSRVMGVALSEDFERFIVQVETTLYEPYGRSCVQDQRDRLASGLYGTSDPIFFGHTS